MSEPSTFPFFDDYSPPPPPFDFCDLGLCFPPPPPPPRPPPPPPPPAKTSSSSTGFKFSTGVVVGIAAGGAVVVLMVVVFLVVCLVCCKKKKDRLINGEAGIYQSAQPAMKPAPSLLAGPAGGVYDGANQHWQQIYPPPPRKDQLPPRPLVPPSPLALSSLSEQYSTTQSSPNTSSSASDSYGSGPTSIGSQSQASLYGNKKRLGFSMNVFSYEDLLRATDGLSDKNFLGQGGFGPVYKGILSNGKEVAVKSLRAGSSQGDREFEAEVETVSRVHHRHLVSLVGYCATETTKLLVYEFVPNGTLQFHLRGKGIPVLNWEARMKIAIGSARGLAYLHYDCNPKIIHRDIKAANILLDSQFEAKVADFGLAKFTSDQDTHVSTRIMGTFGYLAPEYAASGKLTDKSDVFSFGVVLLELITGRNPNSQFNMEDSWAKPLLQMATGSGKFDHLVDPRLENNYNRDEMARMVACASASVHHSARKRPSMSQVARALEGNMSLTELNQGLMPGHSTLNNSSYPSSDYDSGQYTEDLRPFRQAVGHRGQDSGGISSSSEYEGGNTMSQEMETGTSRMGSRE